MFCGREKAGADGGLGWRHWGEEAEEQETHGIHFTLPSFQPSSSRQLRASRKSCLISLKITTIMTPGMTPAASFLYHTSKKESRKEISASRRILMLWRPVDAGSSQPSRSRGLDALL